MLGFLMLTLVAAACSASNDVADSGTAASSTAASMETQNPGTTVATESAPQETTEGGGGDYSVLMLANTDELTARGTLESMEAAGFTGFVLEGSPEEGFDVYKSGLTNQEAIDLLAEILLAPDVNGGLIFETANLP
jgi:hypothetical protein